MNLSMRAALACFIWSVTWPMLPGKVLRGHLRHGWRPRRGNAQAAPILKVTDTVQKRNTQALTWNGSAFFG